MLEHYVKIVCMETLRKDGVLFDNLREKVTYYVLKEHTELFRNEPSRLHREAMASIVVVSTTIKKLRTATNVADMIDIYLMSRGTATYIEELPA